VIQQPQPTPNTDRLVAERDRWVAAGVNGRPFFVARARGARIWDVDGREYLDFVGGIGTVNQGHSNPEIVAAISAQLEDYLHQCYSLNSYEPYIEVCRLLCACHPGDFDKKGFLANSGAEAVENAVKIARYATGRPGIVCLDNAFHGRTLMGMTLTAKVKPYKYAMGPYAPEIYRAPGPYPFRGISSDDAIAGLHRLFQNQIDPSQIAAIIYEPVQGEGGFIPMPEDYPGRLQEIAAEHGILIIADEVQSGMGRTGTPAAVDHYGVTPDLMTWGKSMGGGLPISGVTGRADLMDAVHKGGLGGTYGGNPLSCAASIVALNQVLDPEFQAQATALGERLRAALEKLAAAHPVIGEVRGLGPMLGVEIVDGHGRPDADRTAAIIGAAFDRGLMLMGAGLDSNVIRILVPLVATEADIAEGLSIIESCLEPVAA
jgi:4-aminobutyrate aminotransferase